MIIRETELAGCVTVEPEPGEDERGLFARTFDAAEFRRRGLDDQFVQFSTSFNMRAGTLRGLHFQMAPHEEAKLVRCTRGRVFDVAVDLRSGSATFGCWTSVILDADNRIGLHIPRGFAHGFVSLDDATELSYAISTPYAPDSARGIRWDDPTLNISWPLDVATITVSDRDRALPTLAQFLEGWAPAR